MMKKILTTAGLGWFFAVMVPLVVATGSGWASLIYIIIFIGWFWVLYCYFANRSLDPRKRSANRILKDKDIVSLLDMDFTQKYRDGWKFKYFDMHSSRFSFEEPFVFSVYLDKGKDSSSMNYTQEFKATNTKDLMDQVRAWLKENRA